MLCLPSFWNADNFFFIILICVNHRTKKFPMSSSRIFFFRFQSECYLNCMPLMQEKKLLNWSKIHLTILLKQIIFSEWVQYYPVTNLKQVLLTCDSCGENQFNLLGIISKVNSLFMGDQNWNVVSVGMHIQMPRHAEKVWTVTEALVWSCKSL